MDFANSTDATPADRLPPMGCLADDAPESAADAQPRPAPAARSGVRLRLPPFYILQGPGLPRLGRKSN